MLYSLKSQTSLKLFTVSIVKCLMINPTKKKKKKKRKKQDKLNEVELNDQVEMLNKVLFVVTYLQLGILYNSRSTIMYIYLYI